MPTTPDPAAPKANPTLAELVAQARWPRNPKAIQLESQREELIRLRGAGESVAAINAGLRGLGVQISDEALRLWFKARMPRRKTKRKAKTLGTAGGVDAPATPTPALLAASPVPSNAGAEASPMPPGTETQIEKLQRLRAALPPREPLPPQRSPRIARDDF